VRLRILAFLAALSADAVFIHRQPWPVVVGCVAYLLLVFPALRRRND